MTDPTNDRENHVWVTTEPTLDGTSYAIAIQINEDRSMPLTREGAIRYAMSLLTTLNCALYDAAVLKQMGEVTDGQDELAAQMVIDLRKDRPTPDDEATQPLTFEAGVSQQTRKGFITASLDGKPLWQWDSVAARRHALGVLEAIAVADLDAAYVRQLKGLINVPDHVARNVVSGLGKHREEEDL